LDHYVNQTVYNDDSSTKIKKLHEFDPSREEVKVNLSNKFDNS